MPQTATLIRSALIVGAGGFVGAAARYLVAGWAQGLMKSALFPLGTLTVNVAGCFVIGLLGGLSENLETFRPETRLFVFIGILGGFTTFSTFGYETMSLARDGQHALALGNVTLHVLAGLAAVWVGYGVSQLR